MNAIEDTRFGSRKRCWSKYAPSGTTWDAIVIGSGMGGMTTAGLLARLGRRVLVLEQHYVPGGFTHVFRRNRYEWDVGVHIVGDVALNALPGRVMDLLSGGQLKWQSVGDVYDEFFFPDDFRIAFPGSPEAFATTLKAHFPHATDQVDAWFAELKGVARSLTPWHLSHLVPGSAGRWLSQRFGRHLNQTTSDRLKELVPDEQLRAVLCAQWGYHGVPPSQGTWALQAMVNNHFLQGASYPVGGSSRIAATFLKGVADAGGWTRICADVAEILIEGDRAVGVRLTDGEEILAEQVVSAAGVWNTVTKLLPPSHRDEAWAAGLSDLKPSPAHVCLYVGFKGDIASAGATRHCQWFYDTWSHEHCTWDVDPSRPITRPPLLFTSFPSLKDPQHKPGEEQRHTGELISFVPWEIFQKWHSTEWRDRGPEYDAFKKQMGEQMLEILFEHHPDLRPMVDYWELSTPLSTALFSRPQHGAIYGLAATPERYDNAWLRPKTPIRGLWMSASDIGSCGVVGALMGGVLCALAMEPVKMVPLLLSAPGAARRAREAAPPA